MERRGAYAGPGIGLKPLVGSGIDVLFCGYNPSIQAFRTGHYYANPTNRFYRLLYETGFTPRLLRPDEDGLLPGMGIGVTDLCAVPSARADDLPASSFAGGVTAVEQLVRMWRPKVLCCNGYGVFRALCGRRVPRAGLQPDSLVAGVPLFAVPSSSGAASAYTAARAAAWHALALYVRDSRRPALPGV